MSERRVFSEVEDAFIRRNYREMPYRAISERLGWSEKSISDRVIKLGLRKWVQRPFSSEEDEIIRNGHDRRLSDIARQLGRARSVVHGRATRIGVISMYSKQRYADCNGYKVTRAKRPNGKRQRIPEHRIVMERHLGRILTDDERVHHINGRKRDNRGENLHLCANDDEHRKIHATFNRLMPALVDSGIVRFNRDEGVYELCETSN